MLVCSCFPNPFKNQGFVWGFEHAYLGNCLSTLANLITFSIRTNVPIIYPNISQHQSVFLNPEIARSIFPRKHSFSAEIVNEFTSFISPMIGQLRAVEHGRLQCFDGASGIVLSLPTDRVSPIRDWCDDSMESHVARFCRDGNGIILPRAFWYQYTNMRIMSGYGETLRSFLGELRHDGNMARMTDYSRHSDSVKIAIHIRQSDYKNWYGGSYYYEIEDYVKLIKRLDRELSEVPHRFYIFSENKWAAEYFEGLSVFAEYSSYLDDFSAMGRADYVVGPPSTFATWSAFLGGAKRIIITRAILEESNSSSRLIDRAVDIPFPTGGYLSDDPRAGPV